MGNFSERLDLKDCNVTGQFTATNAHVDTAHFKASCQTPAINSVHRHKLRANQAGSVVTQRIALGIVDGTECAFQRPSVRVTQTACGGAASLSIDILKNGTTMLTAPVTINNASGLALQLPALSATTGVQGDLIEASVTLTLGGGTAPVGLAVQMICDEKPTLA